MSFWNKLKGFLGLPTEESADIKEAKQLIKEAEIMDAAIKEATVKLDKFGNKTKPQRARTKKGTFVADDKSTPNINEAWVGGKAPKKKK